MMKKLYSSNFEDDAVFKRVADWDSYVAKSEKAIDSLDPVDEVTARWNLAKLIFTGAAELYLSLNLEWTEFAISAGYKDKHPAKNGYGSFQEELDQIKDEALYLVQRAVGCMSKYEDEEDDMFEIEAVGFEIKLKIDLDYVDEKYHKYFS